MLTAYYSIWDHTTPKELPSERKPANLVTEALVLSEKRTLIYFCIHQLKTLISWGSYKAEGPQVTATLYIHPGTKKKKKKNPPRNKINQIIRPWFSWDVSTFFKISLPAISNLSPLPGHWNCHRADCKPAQNTSNPLRNNKKFIRRRDVFIHHASWAPTSHKSAQTFSRA